MQRAGAAGRSRCFAFLPLHSASCTVILHLRRYDCSRILQPDQDRPGAQFAVSAGRFSGNKLLRFGLSRAFGSPGQLIS